MELKATVFFWLTAIWTSDASLSIHVRREGCEELSMAHWTISMSHQWKVKVPCMQYACVTYDSMIFRLEECMSPLRLIQNFGMSYTLFMAIELFSVICRTREQANWACWGSKSAGRTVWDLMPSLKAKIAQSMDSMVRPFKNTSISAEKSVRLDWLYKKYLLTSRICSLWSFLNRT